MPFASDNTTQFVTESTEPLYEPEFFNTQHHHTEFKMHGPERWGLPIFGLNNIQEETTNQEWEPQSDANHTQCIRGDLILGVTHPLHRLPRSIWNAQRDGGLLSDGETRVCWTIFPGGADERRFRVVFARRPHGDTTDDRMRSYERWQDFVYEEFCEYMSRGWRQFLGLVGMLNTTPARSPDEWVGHDHPCIEHEADIFFLTELS